MAESREGSPGNDYFNDLTQQPSNTGDEERRGSQEENGQASKLKRVACALCRKRKLRCDGGKPTCGTCTKLRHDCSYDEVRKKSGPKRGYVKVLESRLAQVEVLLKAQAEKSAAKTIKDTNGMAGSNFNDFSHISQHSVKQRTHTQAQESYSAFPAAPSSEVPAAESFPWEMIGMGLEEPLPSQDVINELNQVYFDKVHPSLPMMHRPRYYAAMDLPPHMRPPICLRYAMWCHAAALTENYETLQEHFYLRARKYLQQDEMKGHGESMLTLAHCQAWILVATHEFKLMYFPRAWASSGRANRLSQMLGLYRLDKNGLEVKQCLPQAKDWTELEERRRTFWMGFCVDRYSSIGTGWPMTIDERDILTVLPCDEESFLLSRPEETMSLQDALSPGGPAKLSSFGGVAVCAALFGRNLTHLHRHRPDDDDADLNGEFWRRHRLLDNILLDASLSLPDSLRLPSGMNNPNVVFVNMNIHTSTICLHQAAIFKADQNKMSPRVSTESKMRCITAAAEVASIMRTICHLDLAAMNPFISFCLYVAARVFVQYLKSRPKDGQVRASLQFLLSAMHAIKRKNPLTESFLVQLDVDLQGSGLEDTQAVRAKVAPNGSAPLAQAAACPYRTFGADSTATVPKKQPTFGDRGLAIHTAPNRPSQSPGPAYAAGQAGIFVNTAIDVGPSSLQTHAELPSRQRSPGSYQSSGTYQSPSSFNSEMDTSPDANGGAGDKQTPNSTNHASSQASSTHRSPQDQPQEHAMFMSTQYHGMHGTVYGADPNLFEAPNVTTFTDYEMPNATAGSFDPQSGFVEPDWMLEAPTGFTPGASPGIGITNGNIGPMINISDDAFREIMASFPEWEGGFSPTDTMLSDMVARRS